MSDSSLWSNNRLRLVMTGDCNINCFYCHNEGIPKSNLYFSKELLHEILEINSDNNAKIESVTFTGGEPLLHQEIEYFIKKFVPVSKKRTLVTNGLLLTKEKLLSLSEAGISKIRLGVDSFINNFSRPSDIMQQNRLYEIIDLLFKLKIPFEINVVISKFNLTEIPDILKFCEQNKINAKFFEKIKVHSFSNQNQGAIIEEKPSMLFTKFHKTVINTLKNIEIVNDKIMNRANNLYIGNGFNIRYCRYLHNYGLCYITGTRIDPQGYIYTCMEQKRQYKINTNEKTETSLEIIKIATNERCYGVLEETTGNGDSYIYN